MSILNINLQWFPWIPDSLRNEAKENKGLRGQKTCIWFLMDEKSEAQGGEAWRPLQWALSG